MGLLLPTRYSRRAGITGAQITQTNCTRTFGGIEGKHRIWNEILLAFWLLFSGGRDFSISVTSFFHFIVGKDEHDKEERLGDCKTSPCALPCFPAMYGETMIEKSSLRAIEYMRGINRGSRSRYMDNFVRSNRKFVCGRITKEMFGWLVVYKHEKQLCVVLHSAEMDLYSR